MTFPSPVCVPHALPTWLSWLHQPNCTCLAVQAMKLLILAFSPVSYYILPTKVYAVATLDYNFKILCTFLIAPMHATWPTYFFVPYVIIVSAAEYALWGTSCSCPSSYLQLWVQIFCPVPWQWGIRQIYCQTRKQMFCAKLQPKHISCWSILSLKTYFSHWNCQVFKLVMTAFP